MTRELWNFLVGTFHQDIDSPEVALEEYLAIEDLAWLHAMQTEIVAFLSSPTTTDDKDAIISKLVQVNFSHLSLTPTQWLKDIHLRIEATVNNGRSP